MRRLEFFVDGSCTRPGDKSKRHMGCGIVGFTEGDTVEWSIPLGHGTDAQAELLAVIKALTKVIDRPNTHVVVHSDSQYAIGALTGLFVARAHLWLVEAGRALVAECGKFEMVKVVAHSGDTYNTMADRLARQASRSIEL